MPTTNESNAGTSPLSSGLFALLSAGLVVIYLALAFYRIAEVPLLDPDEPRYAAAGRTISRPGSSLLVPMFNGEKRINKPPLFYWLVALSDKICGKADEISARLPSIVLGLGMLIGTIYLGSAVYGRAIGLLGGLILATTPLFMSLSRTCITDMTLSTFMCGALGAMMLGMLGLRAPRRACWIGAFFLGLAALTKAHTALSVVLALCIERALALPRAQRPGASRFLPWLIFAALLCSGAAMNFDARAKKALGEARHNVAQKAVPAEETSGDEDVENATGAAARYHLIDNVFKYASMALIGVAVVLIIQAAWRAPRGALSEMPWKLALAVGMAMGLWWYVALIVNLGWHEVKALLDKEVGQRLAGSMHREPMYYYLYTFLAVAFPWSIGSAISLGQAWPASENPDSDSTETRADRFLLAWILGIILFFSIPGAKLATYILGAMPAFALLTARAMSRLAARDESLPAIGRRLTAGATALLAFGLIVLGFTYTHLPQSLLDVANKSPVALLPLCIGLALVFFAIWFAALRGFGRLGTVALAATVLVMIGFGLPAALPGLTARSTRELCQQVRDRIADCERVALVGSEVESLPYYLDRSVPECRRRDPDKNEPYDVVIREEMSRPEKSALFVQKRYFARAIGVSGLQFEKLSAAEIEHAVPDYAQFVGTNRDIIVIRNKR